MMTFFLTGFFFGLGVIAAIVSVYASAFVAVGLFGVVVAVVNFLPLAWRVSRISALTARIRRRLKR